MESAVESSAMAVSKYTNGGSQQSNNNAKGKGFQKRETKEEKHGKYFCEHCKMRGHVKEVVQQVLKAMNAKQQDGSSSSGTKSHLSNFADSGASDHMASSKDLFVEMRTLKKPVSVKLLDGTMRFVKEMGSVSLSPDIGLRNVLYIPEFKHNLLTLLVEGQLEQEGRNVVFKEGIFPLRQSNIEFDENPVSVTVPISHEEDVSVRTERDVNDTNDSLSPDTLSEIEDKDGGNSKNSTQEQQESAEIVELPKVTHEVAQEELKRSERNKRILAKFKEFIMEERKGRRDEAKESTDSAGNLVMSSLENQEYYDEGYVASLNNVMS
uniref:Retrovirus-related Pol polyprotein from transposon TNT 1-94-like beta-barrel domain-containing protein n=1 Tax=Chenopodium quinoa TaxID=63459 RepID=A0A803N863_CHEQI